MKMERLQLNFDAPDGLTFPELIIWFTAKLNSGEFVASETKGATTHYYDIHLDGSY